MRSYDSLIGFNLRHKGDELSGSEPCCPRKIILFFFFSLAWSGAELLTPKYTEREQKLSFPGSRDELVCETGKKTVRAEEYIPIPTRAVASLTNPTPMGIFTDTFI